MKKTINDKVLASLKVPETGRNAVQDAITPGLSFVITSHGAKSWYVRYQMGKWPDRVQRTLKLGDGALPIVDARKRANEARTLAAQGTDPAVKAAPPPPAAIQTVSDAFKIYFTQKVAAKLAERTQIEIGRTFNKDVLPAIGHKDIKLVTQSDILSMLMPIIERGAGVKANRSLTYAKTFFDWAVKRKLIPESPAEGVEAPSKEISRDRVLTDTELKLFWHACEKLELPFGPAFQLMALTLQRREEVAGMAWDEIDLDAATWTIPANRTKTKTKHLVTLSERADTLLKMVWERRLNASSRSGSVMAHDAQLGQSSESSEQASLVHTPIAPCECSSTNEVWVAEQPDRCCFPVNDARMHLRPQQEARII